MPKQQFTTKQIKRSRAKLTKQGCNLQKAAIKHKQKLWETLQNPLERTDFKLREHVTYTMLGAVSFKSKAPKSEGAEPIKYPSRSVAEKKLVESTYSKKCLSIAPIPLHKKVVIQMLSLQKGKIVQTVCCKLISSTKRKRYRKTLLQITKTILTCIL